MSRSFDDYREMKDQLDGNEPSAAAVFYPVSNAEGKLKVLYSPEDEWIDGLPLYIECYDRGCSPWPVTKCYKGNEKDFTADGYQHKSTAVLARLVAARFIGCRVELIHDLACIPNDGNFLNCRRENIRFTGFDWSWIGSRYDEFTLDQLSKIVSLSLEDNTPD